MLTSGNDRRLGDVLLDHGLITQAQLKKALSLQKAYGQKQKLGDILVKQGWLSQRDLMCIASRNYHIPLAHALLNQRESFRKTLQEDDVPDKNELAEPPKTEPVADIESVPVPAPQPLTHSPEPSISEPPPKRFQYTLTSLRNLSWETLNADPDHEFAELLGLCLQKTLPEEGMFNKRLTALTPWSHKRDIVLLGAWYDIAARRYPKAQAALQAWQEDQDAVQLWLDAGLLSEDYPDVVRRVKQCLERPKPPLHWYFVLGFALDELGAVGPAQTVFRHYTRHADPLTKTGRYALKRLKEVGAIGS